MNAPLQSLDHSASPKPLFATRQPQSQQHLRHGTSLKEDQDSPATSAKGNKHDETSSRGRPITLTEAFAATQDIDGIHTRSPTAGSFPKDAGSSLIPRPQRSPPLDRRDSPSPSLREHHSRLPRSADRERGRLRATAPSFTPSPPHGLREAYQQVVRLESTADAKIGAGSGHKGQQMNGRIPISSTLRPDRVPSGEHLRMERHSRSGSPASFTRTRRSSPSPDHEAGGSDLAEDADSKPEGTVQSGSGSERSGYSYLQDGTDESFNRELARHARDQERVKGALKNKKAVFSGTRGEERMGLTTENLRRESSATRPTWAKDLENKSKGGSVTSDGSDPPVQVPRGWGSKARNRKDWMSRIPRSGSHEPDSLASKTGESFTGSNWNSVRADEALPSVESTETLPQQSIFPSSPPERRKNDSLDRIRAWEDEEFTARDLQVSTSPPIKVKKNASLDQIREREIEALKDRAVTTSRLGEIKQRTSRDSLKSQGDEGGEETPDGGSAFDPKTPLRSSRSGGSLRRKFGKAATPTEEKPLSTTYEDEGDAIPNTPIVIFKGSAAPKDDKKSEIGTNSDRNAQSSRPESRKEDSQDLLRRLARTTSASPNSSQQDERLNPANTIDTAMQSKKTEATPIIPRADSENDNRLLIDDDDSNKENARPRSSNTGRTPRRDEASAVKATPKITGGWIDTPAPNKSTGLGAPFRSDAESRVLNLDIRDFLGGKQAVQKPGGFFARFRSATSQARDKAPLQELKTESKVSSLAPPEDDFTTDSVNEIPVDDTMMTVDSIQEMLLNDASLTSIMDDDTIQRDFKAVDEHGRPLSEAERARRHEAWKAEQMSKKLRRLQSSIHTAKRGIEGLESKVVGADDGIWQKPSSYLGPVELLRKPMAWVVDEDGSLTRFGWISIACVVLWLIEYMACYNFCHESYTLSSYNDSSDAPLPGWATLYILQQLLPWIFNPVAFIIRFFTSKMDLFWDLVLDILNLPSDALDFGEGSSYGAKHRRVWDLYHIEMRRQRRGW